MKVVKKDVFWNFFATLLKTASSVVLLPLILKKLPIEDVGIWTVFVSMGAVVTMLDMGYGPSFARNITFIFSGVKNLAKEGVNNELHDEEVDYSLLKSTLSALRFFYFRLSIIVFFSLAIGGTYYLTYILQKYSGDHIQVYLAWAVFVLQNSYMMYTDYYESLMIGKGLISIVKKITIFAQLSYLTLASILLLNGFGLIGLFSSQIISILIIRKLSIKYFFDDTLVKKLNLVNTKIDSLNIIRTLFPNAIKSGISSLGSLFINRAPIMIGSFYLTLEQIATFGLTKQIFDIMYIIASIYSITYFPQLSNNWIKNKLFDNKVIYVKCILVSLFIYVSMCFCLILFANPILEYLGSKTLLLSGLPLSIIIINYFFTLIHGQSVPIILSKNYLPLYYVGFIGGSFVILISYILLHFFKLGIYGIIIPPTIVYLSYENWKWPQMAFNFLKLSIKDFLSISYIILKGILNNIVLKKISRT